MDKLSDAQYNMLTNVAIGKAWDSHLVGRSAHGGARSTRACLMRRGFLRNGAITEEGQAALIAAEQLRTGISASSEAVSVNLPFPVAASCGALPSLGASQPRELCNKG